MLTTRKEVYWPKSEGRRLVDFHLGGGAQNSSTRNSAGRSVLQGAPLKKGEAANDVLRELSRKAMELRMRWQKMVQRWMEGEWISSGPARFSGASIHCLVEGMDAKKHRMEWCAGIRNRAALDAGGTVRI